MAQRETKSEQMARREPPEHGRSSREDALREIIDDSNDQSKAHGDDGRSRYYPGEAEYYPSYVRAGSSG